MGVTHTIKPSDKLEKDLRDLTDGHLPDVVIDATGSNVSMSNAFAYIAPGGRARVPRHHDRGGEISASRLPQAGGGRSSAPGMPCRTDFTRIIQLIEAGQIDTKPWITHRARFDELPGLFPSYIKPETGVLKAIIEVDG